MHRILVALGRSRRPVLTILLLSLAVRPAFGQAEITGSWSSTGAEDLAFSGALPVDYTGVPLNEEGRLRALSYNESQLGMIERQCQGWPQFYIIQGPFGWKIWADMEPVKGSVISYTIGAWEDRAPMVIWMDGRPHPSPLAEHTRSGFTTGRWEGNTLVTYTTHMKSGYFRKNGVPSSDQATMHMRFYRHGDLLTALSVVEDPIYLAEPLILTKTYQTQPNELSSTGPPCVTAFQGRMPGDPVPHYVPEQNPFVDELTKRFGVPRDAVLGVPETLYPEYRKKMTPATGPGACTGNCPASR